MKVKVEEKEVSLVSIAQIAARTQVSFMITPFDISHVSSILKTIKDSNMNLNPQLDKNAVRIQVPKTTKETRQQLIKQADAECEKQKSILRSIRKKYMDKVKAIEKSKTTSKDDVDRMKKQIDIITEEVTKELSAMMEKKETELDA